uniref:Bystin n=1 Tax=Chromera velia CCMP2878 TaxID=1169474 RepID=A0A0G4GH02_9ALVE|eukprot:Cvel_21876.t1-p1 / transcript=Cvel_21876.t1 / gene=Cvel_21876 / organism=Chromera_velia_CCMP2878 / gene_product=Bystin, putative / transcript_product=Bystin, putative / location=Cvel_scaffold2091:13794-19810(-) / protein_length=435 / sequence_SO=supercontig / SO=protein_coding / is_pseudo=false
MERTKKTKALRHNPLHRDIEEDGAFKPQRTKRSGKGADDDEEESVLPQKISQKILSVAQDQQDQEDAIDRFNFEDNLSAGDPEEATQEVRFEEGEEEPDVDEEGFVFGGLVDEDEERAMDLFLAPPGGSGEGGVRNLADLILEKIREKEEREARGDAVSNAGDPETSLPPKVVEVYKDVGAFLSKYKSGKVPKAFAIVPKLANWEEVVYVTDPFNWTPHAMREACRIFASSLRPRQAQRFYNLVLLPAVRDDISSNKRLNYHYYEALKKALFKPAAWMKGILLPLASEGCTVREAVIIGSILQKVSVPVLHASAALLRLCQQKPWYGTTSYLIAVLINKKYALPYRVIGALVNHFAAFLSDSRQLPVVWHKALLAFAQRYKYDVTDEQRAQLREVLRLHFHSAIGPEIRRELFHLQPGEAPVTRRVEVGDAMELD